MPVTHVFDDDVIVKAATYSEDGLLMRKCRICGAEIYQIIPKTAYKIDFVCDDGVKSVKVLNSLDPDDYIVSNVAYTRNINSYNYSKFNAGAMVIVELEDGCLIDKISSDDEDNIVAPYNDCFVIAKVSKDVKVTISTKKVASD